MSCCVLMTMSCSSTGRWRRWGRWRCGQTAVFSPWCRHHHHLHNRRRSVHNPHLTYWAFAVTVDLAVNLFLLHLIPYVLSYFNMKLYLCHSEFPANEIVRFLVGFTNKASEAFNVQSLEASFRYPQDFQFYIQNVSLIWHTTACRLSPLWHRQCHMSIMLLQRRPRQQIIISIIHNLHNNLNLWDEDVMSVKSCTV